MCSLGGGATSWARYDAAGLKASLLSVLDNKTVLAGKLALRDSDEGIGGQLGFGRLEWRWVSALNRIVSFVISCMSSLACCFG